MNERVTKSRALALGTVSSCVVLAAGGFAQWVGWGTTWLRSRELYAGIVALIVIAIARPWIDAIAKRVDASRGVGAVWAGCAAGSVGLAAALAVHLDHVFNSSYRVLHPYGSFWELEPETFLAPVAAFVFATVFAFRPAHRLPDSRRAAFVVAAAAGILCAFATVRAARFPSVRDYAASLPVVGFVPSLQGATANLPAQMEDNRSARFDDVRVGPYTLRRFRFEVGWHCVPMLATDPDTLPRQIDRTGLPIVPCDASVLRRDEAHHMLLLDATDGDYYGPGPVAFDARSLVAIREFALSNARVADRLAVPRSWIGGLWIVVAMAAVALLRSRRPLRWLAQRHRWRAGTLRSDHRIHFEDGSAAIPAPISVSALQAGPVIVLDTGSETAGAPFRDRAALPVLDAANLAFGDVLAHENALRESIAADGLFSLTLGLGAAGIVAAAATTGIVF